MIEPWDPEKHLSLVNSWLEARGMGDLMVTGVPITGAVVDHCFVGWVYMTDSGTSFLDSFISDPKADKETKRAATAALIGYLTGVAKQLGATRIVAFTGAKTLQSFSDDLGFVTMAEGLTYYERRV